MGGGGETKTTQQTQSGPPNQLSQPMLDIGSQMISGDPAQRLAAQTKSMYSPAYNTILGNLYAAGAAGENLDPATNPALQRVGAATTEASQTQLGKNLANLQSQFAQGGQYNLGQSSPLTQATTQAMTQSNKDLTGALAEQNYNAYKTERGMQGLDRASLQAWNNAPLATTEGIASQYQTGSTSGTSSYSPSALGILGSVVGK